MAAKQSVADRLFHISPLQYEYVNHNEHDINTAMLVTTTAPTFAAHSIGLPNGENLSVGGKTFVIQVFPAPDYRHASRIRESPLYGPWPREHALFGAQKTFAKSALSRVVPPSLATPGLVDWERGGQLDKEPQDAGLSSRVDHIKNRQLQKKIREKERERRASMGLGALASSAKKTDS